MTAAPAGRGMVARLRAMRPARRWAVLAGVVWAVLVVAYAVGYLAATGSSGRGTVFLDGMFFLAALVLPLVAIWLAGRLAEELAEQRALVSALAEVTPPLFEALAATRAALERHGPASPEAIEAAVRAGSGPDLAAPLERALAGHAQILDGLQQLLARAAPPPAAPTAAAPEPRRAKPRARPAAEAEPALPLLPEAEASSLPDWPELIRALDFPRDADDREGFRALKKALRHHSLALMLQAAEDVLNLLSQQGIYMDDLAVDPVDAEAWRRFMAGARGAAVAGVGGIRDERALEAARALTKSDPIFRDTALFFQRRFDVVLSEFAANSSDARIAELAATRSGRAFMLLGRLSGSFG